MNPDEIYLGLTWQDMSGRSPEARKMNFCLFKRNKLNPSIVERKMTK